MPELFITHSTLADIPAVLSLYVSVAAIEGGLARTADEISEVYVRDNISSSLNRGISLVARIGDCIVGEIHAFQPIPKVFSHVLSDLTIAVHPAYQGRGIGRALFCELLQKVTKEHRHILRVELLARESNQRAIDFYKTLGFEIEGVFKGRIKGLTGALEADIPMAWHRLSQ
ncbi:N-acetyltransferase [Formosimonas limnophila]|uniref:N-acetyltransferase n=1 Tax=Formosimonas limnophila TaxID=1384487 RepID=A0A8J3CM29_9BURK|nr:GNAT family N-acetyltransferase [Formosimonas limnophila]GHA68385.1 N-acetyltransferase [Formosimonas limnophila]